MTNISKQEKKNTFSSQCFSSHSFYLFLSFSRFLWDNPSVFFHNTNYLFPSLSLAPFYLNLFFPVTFMNSTVSHVLNYYIFGGRGCKISNLQVHVFQSFIFLFGLICSWCVGFKMSWNNLQKIKSELKLKREILGRSVNCFTVL